MLLLGPRHATFCFRAQGRGRKQEMMRQVFLARPWRVQMDLPTCVMSASRSSLLEGIMKADINLWWAAKDLLPRLDDWQKSSTQDSKHMLIGVQCTWRAIWQSVPRVTKSIHPIQPCNCECVCENHVCLACRGQHRHYIS